ncbi:hypothetical protein BV22DRAFT_1134553 [Leucogyrophana mollusca]|uniref:Uncharacterized protein n=1 Tax=Leucogyrophana mollusca TaxID=85980 RepID=A0ACB8AZT1_9AGAM|nr:hypothetical protein BV22DRAFT_1134553 [Leucogyrophana mollusca]
MSKNTPNDDDRTCEAQEPLRAAPGAVIPSVERLDDRKMDGLKQLLAENPMIQVTRTCCSSLSQLCTTQTSRAFAAGCTHCSPASPPLASSPPPTTAPSFTPPAISTSTRHLEPPMSTPVAQLGAASGVDPPRRTESGTVSQLGAVPA